MSGKYDACPKCGGRKKGTSGMCAACRYSTVKPTRSGPRRTTDPRLRPDGRCAACRKPLGDVAREHHDPYCSSKCCRGAWGVMDRIDAGDAAA